MLVPTLRFSFDTFLGRLRIRGSSRSCVNSLLRQILIIPQCMAKMLWISRWDLKGFQKRRFSFFTKLNLVPANCLHCLVGNCVIRGALRILTPRTFAIPFAGGIETTSITTVPTDSVMNIATVSEEERLAAITHETTFLTWKRILVIAFAARFPSSRQQRL